MLYDFVVELNDVKSCIILYTLFYRPTELCRTKQYVEFKKVERDDVLFVNAIKTKRSKSLCLNYAICRVRRSLIYIQLGSINATFLMSIVFPLSSGKRKMCDCSCNHTFTITNCKMQLGLSIRHPSC